MKKLFVLLIMVCMLASGVQATQWLKQSTAKDFYYEIYDSDTGLAKTGLSIRAANVYLSKNGGAWTAKNETTAAVESGVIGGTYLVKLNTTDTATLGTLDIRIADANTDASVHTIGFMVADANLWNPYFSTGEVDIYSVRGSTPISSSDVTAAVPTVAQIEAVIEPNLNLIKTAVEKIDTASELQTLLTGAATPVAKGTELAETDANVALILADTATIDTVGEIATAVWGAAIGTYSTAGTFGHMLNDDDANLASIISTLANGTYGLNALHTDIAAVPAASAVSVFAKTGITAGGTYTFNDFCKAAGAWMMGTWKSKTGDATTTQILDWQDHTTVILELKASSTTPFKTVTPQ